MLKLKLRYKYWIMFLVVVAAASLSAVIFSPIELVQSVGVEVAGSSIFILLLSIVFKKMLV